MKTDSLYFTGGTLQVIKKFISAKRNTHLSRFLLNILMFALGQDQLICRIVLMFIPLA